MAPNTTDPLRTAAVRDFLEEYRDAHIEKTWEYDEEELPEMYDDHHTQAEIKVVQAASSRLPQASITGAAARRRLT